MGITKLSQELANTNGVTDLLDLHEFGQILRDCIRWLDLAKQALGFLYRNHRVHGNVSMDLWRIANSQNCSLPVTWNINTDNTTRLEMMKGSEQNRLEKSIELARLVQEFTEKLEHDPYQPGVVHPELYPDDLQEVIEDLFFVRGFSEASLRIVKNPDGMSIQVQVLERGGINNKNRPSSDETSKV